MLILTNTEDATADYLVGKLRTSEIPYLRIDTDTLLSDLSLSYRPGQPSFAICGTTYSPSDFANVWYRRPEALKVRCPANSPEETYALKEWTEAFEAILAHIPKPRWMNHPSCNVAASSKLEQLTTASLLGFNVPKTLVTQDSAALLAFRDACGGNLIAKPMAPGKVERPNSDDTTIIYTNLVTDKDFRNLSDLANCPTLFQECVNKHSDIRITVVDHEIHAVTLKAQDDDGSQRCDIRRNNMEDVKYSGIQLPPDIEKKVRALVSHYHLRFAAIDMAVDVSNEWVFFEINPNGQWAWLDLCASQNIAASFIRSFS